MQKHAFLTILMLAAVFSTLPAAQAGGLDAEIEKGDSRALVIEILGEPDGIVGGGNYEMLYYERGKVELVDGKVRTVNLISESEAAKRRAARIMAERDRQRSAGGRGPGEMQKSRAKTAADSKPAAASAKGSPAKPPQSVDDLTEEQQAELEDRIAEGISEPPIAMSRSKLRRYRRGRSESLLDRRQEQITEKFLSDLQAGKVN